MKQAVSIFFTLAIFWMNARAQVKERTMHFNLTEKSVAIGGYDPVAYFMLGKAKVGQSSYAVWYEGATYYFSSLQHKSAFLKEPSRYEPQYGGWCAYAMGQTGEKVAIDPETFKIVDGKLYLFYNRFFNNTLKSWNKNESQLKRQAELNWSRFLTKNSSYVNQPNSL